VTHLQLRLMEAQKLGFRTAVVAESKSKLNAQDLKDIRVGARLGWPGLAWVAAWRGAVAAAAVAGCQGWWVVGGLGVCGGGLGSGGMLCGLATRGSAAWPALPQVVPCRTLREALAHALPGLTAQGQGQGGRARGAGGRAAGQGAARGQRQQQEEQEQAEAEAEGAGAARLVSSGQ
jgi:hypothetical protein